MQTSLGSTVRTHAESSRTDQGVSILLYHRVAAPKRDPQLLVVSPEHFAEHMDALREHGPILSLCELATVLDEGDVPRRGVVVTFDDGYADNLHAAKPVLERAGVAATVFVTAGYLGSPRPFWWDELDSLALGAGALPKTLRLRIGNEEYAWSGNENAPSMTSGEGWSVLSKAPRTARQRLYCELFERLRPLADSVRRGVLDELRSWAGEEERQTDGRPMTHDELHRLNQGDLIEIGAHTCTHPVLSAIPIGEQEHEIAGSRRVLQDVLGRSIEFFSYPYGTRHDYVPATVTAVRRAGFRAACSNFAGVVRSGCDPFQLPRMIVRDWTGDELLKRLHHVRTA